MSERSRPVRDYDLTFKLIALGDAAVGKTSCLRRFREDTFTADYVATLGTVFTKKMLDVKMHDGNVYRTQLVLWDLAGQSAHRGLRTRYMKGASMAILVYDVTRPITFKNTREWFEAFQEICTDAVIALVANKVDRADRRVSKEEGEIIAESIGALFYETSAKTGHNIEKVFQDLVSQFFVKYVEKNKALL